MSKRFDEWNKVKKKVDNKDHLVGFKQRDIFHTIIGENIGFEQNGKGHQFVRPVLIYKRLSKDMFIGMPLTTTSRVGSFFYQFQFLDNKTSTVILIQAKLFSMKRLLNKIGVINKEDFENLQRAYLKLLK